MGAGRALALGAGMAGIVVKVTVLMPVRDTPAWMLDQAIDSILAQSFGEFEFLIVDDGSGERATLDCLERRARQDARIRIERRERIGLTRALNAGIEIARGEWIARQDADDWSDRRRLESQLNFLRSNPEIELCGTTAWMHQANGRALWRTRPARTQAEIRAVFPNANPFVHGSTIFRRDRAREIGGYRERFTSSQDYDFFWRLSERAAAANLDEPLYHYRYSGAAVSARKAIDQARAHRAARVLAEARRKGQPEDVAEALAGARDSGDELRAGLKQADHLLLAGEYGRACAAYWRLAWSRPASALAWGKLARWGIFVSLPPMRELCFR